MTLVRAATPQPSVAFFYGESPPIDALSTFDWVVVEPGNLAAAPTTGSTRWFAYMSLGEITADQPYAKLLPSSWVLGKNEAWGGVVVDQSQADWPTFVVDKMVTPLYQKGYRGLFLDTLDSWQIVAKTPQSQQAQIDGLARAIRAIRVRYPDMQLIANRGFEVMPSIHADLAAVAFESLYRGWDQSRKRYVEVSEADRTWLKQQLAPIVNDYKLPVIAIDYVAPAKRALARRTAEQILADGYIPWVADPYLKTLGVGLREVQPRTVLFLYDGQRFATPMRSDLLALLTPLNYLGLKPEFVDVRGAMPAGTLVGRYAGIVSWLDGVTLPASTQAWLRHAIDDGLPWVTFAGLGVETRGEWAQRLGLIDDGKPETLARKIVTQSPLYGFEIAPRPQRDGFRGLTAKQGEPLLSLSDANGRRFDAAAIMPWGGYVLDPYFRSEMPDQSNRWQLDPIAFFQRALRLPPGPIADVTTENGRRVFLMHLDGDGFVSRAEMPKRPYAGEVMLNEVLKKYGLPATVSVIEGEVAQTGLYPKDSAAAEAIARQIFALPNVEIASHSYSHPFQWGKINTDNAEDYHLEIPGYTLDLNREITGSIDYINHRLAPPGKQTKVFLWTGDCKPMPDAVALTRKAGVLNMNGGDTVITKRLPSITAVAPVGLPFGGELQIFAPNQNENVYTNDWTGPFYGYRRVIETFEMTDGERRLKPINIYLHFYAASKRASLDAVQQAVTWALSKPITPMFASQYIERANAFFSASVSRDDKGFAIHAGALRTVRIPTELGYPDIGASRNIAGFSEHGKERYVHLAGDNAYLALQATAPTQPYLADASGLLKTWQSGPGKLSFALDSTRPLTFAMANTARCSVRADNVVLTPRNEAALQRYTLSRHAAQIDVNCG
ncbi:bifunctional glycoside hydrolase 114/ polysaccharide deacetylase family protein [Jeongeupia wiesaeckerbachi]|uniref:bifunctional glycoside hydrolase 114/ polysaccharide deacetylase family protein n=1 Tax=Jeongeupia wiesaeckerbachi TaxID=3051218 RepID=UPI003D80913D